MLEDIEYKPVFKSGSLVHEKNGFAEVFITNTDVKIILLNYQNNNVECSDMMSNAVKSFDSSNQFERSI